MMSKIPGKTVAHTNEWKRKETKTLFIVMHWSTASGFWQLLEINEIGIKHMPSSDVRLKP